MLAVPSSILASAILASAALATVAAPIVKADTLAAPIVKAKTLSMPTGQVVLTVTGDIFSTNQSANAEFDVEMLKSLGEVSFETTTPWTDGVQTFTGVPLYRLAGALGVTEGTLNAVAVNDYSVEVPVSDAVEDGPIIAYLQNGSPMSVREKGPLWIVYPYDLNKDYQSEVSYSRSIWQLVRVDVNAN